MKRWGKSTFPISTGEFLLWEQGKQWYFCQARQKYPKTLFSDRTAIRRAKPDPRLGYRVRFVQTFRLSLDCLTVVLLQTLQCLAVVIHSTRKSVQTFFVSVSDRRYFSAFHLSCSCWKLSAYRKVCPAPFVKGEGIEKGRGNPPSLFCVFGSFCHSTKGTSFSLSFGKGAVSFLLTEAGGTMVLFSKAKWYFAAQSTRTPKCFLRIAQRSVGQSRMPGFAIAFVFCRLSVRPWTA